MEGSTTNRARLEQAGLVKPTYQFTPEQANTLEQLSREEVDALIAIGSHLGPTFLRDTGGGDDDTVGVLF